MSNEYVGLLHGVRSRVTTALRRKGAVAAIRSLIAKTRRVKLLHPMT
jgi:hypothetical protein